MSSCSEYSIDLKERILLLTDAGFGTAEIASLLAISADTVSRTIKKDEQNLPLTRSQRGHRPYKLDGEEIEFIMELLGADPTMTMDEISSRFGAIDVKISARSLERYMDRCGITNKQVSRIALEQDDLKRAAFMRKLEEEGIEGRQLVCVDETAVDQRLTTRLRGWAKRGERVTVKGPFTRPIRFTVIPALACSGYIHVNVIEGALNHSTFRVFIEGLLPKMNVWPGDNSVILMDNAKVHRDQDTLELIENSGCRYIFIPPYSPDLNPIEESFHQFKNKIRKDGTRSRSSLSGMNDGIEGATDYILEALGVMSADNARGYFIHAGYLQS